MLVEDQTKLMSPKGWRTYVAYLPDPFGVYDRKEAIVFGLFPVPHLAGNWEKSPRGWAVDLESLSPWRNWDSGQLEPALHRERYFRRKKDANADLDALVAYLEALPPDRALEMLSLGTGAIL